MIKNDKKIAIIADTSKKSALLFKEKAMLEFDFFDLNQSPELAKQASVVLVIGGDGFLLHTVHQFLGLNLQFYGINYGSVGFLLNEKPEISNILREIENSSEVKLRLLKTEIETTNGIKTSYAMNEISLFRAGGQVAKIKIYVDGVLRIKELVADGVILSTAAGSTAYNFSLHGPIFSPEANVLSLCPISPFRPRHWRGALLLENSEVRFEVLEEEKRPVLATTDFHHFDGVISVSTRLSKTRFIRLLLNNKMPLSEKILAEQFLI